MREQSKGSALELREPRNLGLTGSGVMRRMRPRHFGDFTHHTVDTEGCTHTGDG